MKEQLAAAIRSAMNAAVMDLHEGQRGTCCVEGCHHDSLAKGMCNLHYLRSRKGSDLLKPAQAINPDGQCVECSAPINNKGGWMRCAKHFKLARQKAIKKSLVDAFGGQCQHCFGVFSPSVFDFHHLGNKEHDPSHLIANGSIDRIAEELSKCILLCANCHRSEHAS